MYFLLSQSQLILTSEAMKIGIGSPSFHDFLANFIGLLASHGEDQRCQMAETVSGQMLLS